MTQDQAVLDYMHKKGVLSPMTAFYELGITKLATIVSRLIRQGVVIYKMPFTVRNRYGNACTFTMYSLKPFENKGE